jgi:hypothetical protein
MALALPQEEPIDPRTKRFTTNWWKFFLQLIGASLGQTPGVLTLSELTTPPVPLPGVVQIFAQDNGAGKAQLMAQFPTGAAQQILIEL